MDSSPLQALTLIAAPAVLTNAVSLLALGTSNRFARAIDRARHLAARLEQAHIVGEAEFEITWRQFERVQHRTLLLLRALRSFYLALGLLAGASLLALLQAILDPELHRPILRALPVVALVAGALGVTFLSMGCILLIRETRLAVASVGEEAEIIRQRYRERGSGSP